MRINMFKLLYFTKWFLYEFIVTFKTYKIFFNVYNWEYRVKSPDKLESWNPLSFETLRKFS